MSWKSHINKIATKISKFNGTLCRIKHYVPGRILKTLYNSMIESHLRYCILAWGFESNRIAKLQKKAIRTISNAKYNAHTEPLLKKLKILKVSDLFSVSCLQGVKYSYFSYFFLFSGPSSYFPIFLTILPYFFLFIPIFWNFKKKNVLLIYSYFR